MGLYGVLWGKQKEAQFKKTSQCKGDITGIQQRKMNGDALINKMSYTNNSYIQKLYES